MTKKRKTIYIVAVVVVVLIVLRLLLPGFVKDYVNKTLQEIPGYWGEVEDIDISLIRGAYVIKGLKLDKVNDKEKNIPFLNFPKTDISIHWKSIFRGKIVSEIYMDNPEITLIFEEHAKEHVSDTLQEPTSDDWSEALTDLVPIKINRLEIDSGKFRFLQFTESQDIDLYIDQIYLTATNLRNVVEEDKKLPSTVSATAVSIGQGKVVLDGRMDLVQKIPDIDMDFSLEKADVTALNPFTLTYAKIDFERGQFDLYSEVVIKDGYFKGYFKPILTDVKILDSFKKEDSSIFKKLWEGFVGFFKFIFKNQKKDTLATRIPVEGDLNNVDASIWATIGGILRNAFIEAFKGEVDETLEFDEAFDEDFNEGFDETEETNKE